jgi:4-hydroxy-tetrahydrodipicolinate synthase
MFRGAYTALVTPFADGRVDDEALTRLVERQIAAGIDGLVPCGTTGESSTLSHAEHVHVVEVCLRAANGRIPVLAGAGSNNTREAIELARACKELGVAGTLQITPYYNRPPQEGLVRHFEAIADAVGLPMVLYNVPGRTGCDLLPETVERLAGHEMIVGIKEATGSMTRAAEIRRRCGPDFDLLSGDDFTILPFVAVGGDGVISVTSNILPGEVAELIRSSTAGDLGRARELHGRQAALAEVLFAWSNPIPAKAALAILGACRAEVRSPLVPLPEGGELHPRIQGILAELGIES